MVSVVVSVTRFFWCGLVAPMGLDMCWVMDASAHELKPWFPTTYWLIVAASGLIIYGLPLLLFILTVAVFWSKIPWLNMGIAAASFIIALLLAEMVLRLVGYHPGQFTYNKDIHPVDSLYTVKGYVTDEFGIKKVDTDFFYNQYMKEQDVENVVSWVRGAKTHTGVFRAHLFLQWKMLKPDNEFWHVHDSIARAGATDAWSEAYLQYAHSPINADGFYSIPFDTVASSRKRILLLGDSFTWGHSTFNLTNSFANRLLARGYQVYNTGISSTDVAQYAGILNRYIGKLKPDMVIVNFCMGNDVDYIGRKLMPYVPVTFHTNAGRILSFQAGHQFETKEKAYDNLMRNMLIPQTTPVNRIMSRTVLSTLIWEFLVHRGIIAHQFIDKMELTDKLAVNDQLRDMQHVCDSLGIRFILSSIPEIEQGKLQGAETVNGLFKGILYHQPQVTPKMYFIADRHFNNAGHLFYANYLEQLIERQDSN